MKNHGRVLAFAGRVPPREVQLWNVGDNPTDYGVHKWTDRSVQEVLTRYLARGNPLLVDIDHNVGKRLVAGALPPEKPAATAGYARLELRDGAPWLCFEWSDEGERQITTGERRFLSPEYDTDPETGEILHLYRVSLVGDPGTHHARVLAANPTGANPMISPEMRAALNACLSAEDPTEAIKALLAEVDKASPGAESPSEGDAAGAAPPAAAPHAEPDEDDKPAMAGTDDPPVAAGAPCPPAKVAAAAAAPAAGAPPVPVVPKLPKTIVAPRVAASAAPVVALDDVAKAAVATATSSSSKAVAAVDDLRRDMLLRDHGAKLTPAIRKWAESQPLAVVQSYFEANPSELAPPAIPVPTRGGNGAPGKPVLHTAEAKERFKSATDLPVGPVVGGDGVLRIHACCPSEYRAQVARHHAAGAAK